ncbi:MAG: GDP-mannose 4,6-dehydratase [bacterium]|uniref:GDP-mannose 4,6-dehydratase n=1 Tax=Candidatus Methylomirabilis tolerans TaxID=3123416 RepID=A0AAJ1ESU9_9BACT|nr:GDP-mannose 4,6-dehydratase [Candidatus Methylomirabilis sp.]
MKVLITGGCGFIGCNATQRLLRLGHLVTVLDNLSRPGSDRNLEWLGEQGDFDFIESDVCDAESLASVIARGHFDVVIHLAAQVAVTTSVVEPRRDFEINALGTLNVLEAVRQHSLETILLNASTNKVYGKLPDLNLREDALRCLIPDLPHGVSETQPLDFHSPYGCSKGAADQYVNDYARIYGLRTVNFRQSCIYGYRQFGVEDQGWVAWFTIAHTLGQPVTIYGTGKQVRDILFIDDLIDGYLAAIDRIDQVSGVTFNIGGGPENTLSLLELLEMLGEHSGRAVVHSFEDWRPGDQPVYVSDIRRAAELLSWRPRVGVKEGFERLHSWVKVNRDSFAERR